MNTFSRFVSLIVVGCSVFALPVRTFAQPTGEAALPFRNPDLPLEQRADDLVSRMTLAEKAAQMMTDAPAIPRLGIPAYFWWSESLHGDAVTPATVFPQAIGLAATWDIPLHAQVATAIGDEDRATYNETSGKGTPQSFHGLTFFAPNINIFRDPRWGRGQETYGEDPYLTGRFGATYVKGLQGDDPRYLKVAATAKHYAVHSGPEPERHIFNAVVSPYDLNDTYLPAFEACVREGGVRSVMGAYSSLYGVPDCASPLLLNDILRQKWGFTGYVVSDCGAITDIYANHHYAKDAAEASALAVKAGCDLACDNTYSALPDAVKRGLISEAEVNRAVKRLFVERIKLGMFDPPARVPYSKLGASVIDSSTHRQLALRAARESLVLLKNQNNALPFSKKVKSIAVIGPNANDVGVLRGNYNGNSSHEVSVLEGIKRRAGNGVRVEYAQGSGLTSLGELSPIPGAYLRSEGQTGLRAEYFNNTNLEGAPSITRRDKDLAFNFGTNSPVPGLTGQNYSVRWTGELLAPQDGEYILGVRGDDGFRLFVNNEKVIEDWSVHPPDTRYATLTLKANQAVPIRLEYYQAEGGAEVTLLWHRPVAALPFNDAVKVAQRCDVVVYVGGISSALEGEEGTNGNGDRANLDLPLIQQQLLEALAATGKPIVMVLMNGSALSVNWAQAHIPAILETWYSGEEGGTAIAEALFGDTNPGGRLPVTFYQSTSQLPPFRDYAMNGRTYRYFAGAPLYPFGYGLSYTRFRYSQLKVPARVAANAGVTITARVENSGEREGDEVVQLYLRPAPSAAARQIAPDQPMPRLVLSNFARVHLAPGERRTVSFSLKPEQLRLINAQGERALQPGQWQVFVGGGQPNLANPTQTAANPSANVVSGMLTVR